MTEKTSHSEPRPAASPELISRRAFLEKLMFVLGAIGTVAVSIPLVGYVLSPVLKRDPKVWRSVGKVNDFKVGTVTAVAFVDSQTLPWDGLTNKTGAWLRRDSDTEFIAFALTCTHLGCPVRWMGDAQLFMCPCHGGVYYKDGSVAAGPPPHPLPRFEVRVNGDDVEIGTAPLAIQRG